MLCSIQLLNIYQMKKGAWVLRTKDEQMEKWVLLTDDSISVGKVDATEDIRCKAECYLLKIAEKAEKEVDAIC